MSHINNTTAVTHIPSPVWSAMVSRAFRPSLVLGNLVTNYSADSKNYGDSVHIPKSSLMDAPQKVTNTAVQFQAPIDTDATIPLNQYRHAAFLLEEKTRHQSWS